MYQCSVINLVDVILVLEYSRLWRQRSFLEDPPAETDTRQANQDRNKSKPTLGTNLFTRMRGVRHFLRRHKRSLVRAFGGSSSRGLAMCCRRDRSHGRFQRVRADGPVL